LLYVIAIYLFINLCCTPVLLHKTLFSAAVAAVMTKMLMTMMNWWWWCPLWITSLGCNSSVYFWTREISV